MKTTMILPSELIINDDGSIFHLHLRPEQLADRIILVGDPARVTMIGEYLDEKECDVRSREFHTITGRYHGKRITVVSHGIGGDNIDIVLNELDALANIDLATRTVKPDFRQLTMVRIGTSGGLQPSVPVGIYFYDQTEQIRDTTFEKELLRQLDWTIDGLRPYVVPADPSLLEQITLDDIQRGITIAANGFYGAQGRSLRLPLTDPELNRKIEAFDFEGQRITNFEMESSALAGLSALMGHRALTVCCIIAGRVDKNMNTDYKTSLIQLIEKVIERI